MHKPLRGSAMGLYAECIHCGNLIVRDGDGLWRMATMNYAAGYRCVELKDEEER